METKIALLVIYNHRYDKNIPRLERIYEDKFSHIFHIVPFYDGDKDNVIAVYDTSYCFGGYIAQAYGHIKYKGFTHYFIIADDMILSPFLTEKNIFEKLGLCEDEDFTPSIREFGKSRTSWLHTTDALFFTVCHTGAEIYSVLPSKKEADMHFKSLGIDSSKLTKSAFWKALFCRRVLLKSFFQIGLVVKRLLSNPFGRFELEYPLVGGYADIGLLTAETMPKVCQYVGAFSATGLFVEIGLPTSIVLASNKLKTECNLRLKGKIYWDREICVFEEKYNYNLDILLENYPNDIFYIHPIKLSKWKSVLFKSL